MEAQIVLTLKMIPQILNPAMFNLVTVIVSFVTFLQLNYNLLRRQVFIILIQKYILGDFWHMIVGGSNGTSLLDSVELFNWKTREQCMLKSKLPITISEHSGIVFDGVPIFCGGYGLVNTRQKGCYKLDKDTKNWQNVRKEMKECMVYKKSIVNLIFQ